MGTSLRVKFAIREFIFLVLATAWLVPSQATGDVVPVIWGVSITHQAGNGWPSAPIYASDNLAFQLVDEIDHTSYVDYSIGRVGGDGTIRLQTVGDRMEISYDLVTTMSAGGRTDIWNVIDAHVRITPYAPEGDSLRIQVENQLNTVSRFTARRGDPTRASIVDVDLAGIAGSSPWYDTVTYDGIEYGQVFDNWNNGYTVYYMDHLWNYYGNTPNAQGMVGGKIVITANNLSRAVPEPTTVPVGAAILLVCALQRRKRKPQCKTS